MNNAITIIRYIFTKFLDLIFNRFELFTNVTIGWIMVSVVIIGIMIANILNVARNSQSHRIERNTDNG